MVRAGDMGDHCFSRQLPFGKAEGRHVRVGEHGSEHAYGGKQCMVLGISMSALD